MCISALLTLLLAGCQSEDQQDSSSDDTAETSADTDTDTTTLPTDSGEVTDADGDGYDAEDDCDDTDASVYPGATDSSVDGVDQDCDGLDGPDADGDGYVDVAAGGDDCDDSDGAVHPDADDLSIDGMDQNCDGLDGPDADGDGHVDVAAGGDDCDDSRADTYPGAPEPGLLSSDKNCDGAVSDRLVDADHVMLGASANDQAGYTMTNAGDVDGDGLDDILIGAYGAGEAYLVLGSTLQKTPQLDLGVADYVFQSTNSTDLIGYSLSGAGDFDGDGLADLLISAPYSSPNGTYSGQVYLVLGRSLGTDRLINLANADYIFTGEAEGDYAGTSASGAGDVNGDGYSDILIGAYGSDTNGILSGTSYLISGEAYPGYSVTKSLSAADRELWGEGVYSYTGQTLASAGDVDGDGLDDILIGAPNSTTGVVYGVVYVLLGDTLLHSNRTINLSNADYRITTNTSYTMVGYGLSGAGDVDGDGLDDLLIGTYTGAAYVVMGSQLAGTQTINISAAAHTFTQAGNIGIQTAGVGDLDSDGLDDIMVGSDQWEDCFLFFGGSLSGGTMGMSDADYTFSSEFAGDKLGRSFGSGDVNGDGRLDLLMGAYSNDDAGYQAGKIYAVLNHL